MYVDIKWISEKFDYYNQLCFEGKCPKCAFKVNKAMRYWGQAHVDWKPTREGGYQGTNFTITMSNSFDSPEEIKINTLVHEMIHIMDYCYHPEHFIVMSSYGGFKRVRYDAHGPIFFLREARRLEKYGLKIYQCVQKEEESMSTLNPEIANKEYYLCCLHYVKGAQYAKDDCLWFKCTPGTKDTILSSVYSAFGYPEIKYKDGSHNSGRCAYFDMYATHDIKYQQYPSSRSLRGWWISEEAWNEKLDALGDDCRFVDAIEYSQKSPRHQVARPTFVAPTVFTGREDMPKKDVIPYFKLNLTNGRKLELKNKTIEEIKAAIKAQFPNMKDEVIDKVVNNPGNRRVSESRQMEIILESINEVMMNDSEDFDDGLDYNTLKNGDMYKDRNGVISMDLA